MGRMKRSASISTQTNLLDVARMMLRTLKKIKETAYRIRLT